MSAAPIISVLLVTITRTRGLNQLVRVRKRFFHFDLRRWRALVVRALEFRARILFPAAIWTDLSSMLLNLHFLNNQLASLQPSVMLSNLLVIFKVLFSLSFYHHYHQHYRYPIRSALMKKKKCIVAEPVRRSMNLT